MKIKIRTILVLLTYALSASAQPEWVRVGTVTLQECLEKGLSNNYSIRMILNKQEESENNATKANAGLLPTVDLSASYNGDLGTTRTTSRETDIRTTDRNAYDQNVNAGINLNWTLFDGFSVWTNYKQLASARTRRITHKISYRRSCIVIDSRIL